MTQQHKQGPKDNELTIHQYYMDIINCMPHVVYWVDLDCMLKGCNQNFVKLLGLKRIKDFVGTPYEQMSDHLKWPAERIDAFKLHDLEVIFSSQATYDFDEPPILDHEGTAIYYRSRRVPLFDKEKKVTGLVVVLEDITRQKLLQNQVNVPSPRKESHLSTTTRKKH